MCDLRVSLVIRVTLLASGKKSVKQGKKKSSGLRKTEKKADGSWTRTRVYWIGTQVLSMHCNT